MSQVPIDLQIDYQFLRLPYEYSVKQFKNQRRQVEKEMAQIMQQIIEIQTHHPDTKEAQSQINNLIQHLNEFRKKVGQHYTEMDQSQSVLKSRIQLLQSNQQMIIEDVEPFSQKDITKENCVHDLKMNRLIIDQLVRMGHFKTALKMIKVYHLEEYVQMEYLLIQECFYILQDLKKHSIKQALQWCHANRTRLIKNGSQFEFSLILQEYIELLRKGHGHEALAYLKNSIKQCGTNFKYFKEVEKAMGCLLIMKQLAKFPQYQHYFEDERWKDLIQTFKVEMQNLYSLSVEPPLIMNLQAGLSSLKSLYCSIPEFQKPNVCPLCNKIMGSLIQKLPTTQKGQSSWICRITGEIMDDNNPPLMLPNNQVYSTKALQKLANKSNGKVYCPITKDEFNLTQATRVYLS